MLSDKIDTIVIGAGHAGLSISYYLKQLRIDHIVFEKGTIGSSWSGQRWDSFRFNTPNKYNLLPGQENTYIDKDGFITAREFVTALCEYSKMNNLPVAENCEVISIGKIPGSKEFSVSVRENNSFRSFRSKKVIVASGGQNKRYVPAFSDNIPKDIFQIHACEYRNPSALPDGAVLVIGGAQSGVQITEDLLSGGRKVFLSTSRVPRAPRRYRGRDIVEWLHLTGFFDIKTADISDPRLLLMKFPQISGVGERGHTVSLQALAGKGAVLTGNAVSAGERKIFFQAGAADNVRFADDFSKKVKQSIDEFILRSGYEPALNEDDPADLPDQSLLCPDITSLDLFDNHISSVIWTCGFVSDPGFLSLPVFDANGALKHHEGISDIEGLYFIGFPWLRKRKSGIVMGIKEDAEYITEHLKVSVAA
jgi:putative flavoprotein involved in K+ transport